MRGGGELRPRGILSDQQLVLTGRVNGERQQRREGGG